MNICDTVTNVVPLYPLHQDPLYEPRLILLAPFSTQLAYLNMLFIPEMACTASNAGHLKNKYQIQRSKLLQKIG